MSARILLVEDDPIWQGVISRCMEEEGYEVEVVRDVKSAREKLGLDSNQPEAAKFDLLIVDIRLPYNDEGLQLVAELQERQNEAGISPEEQPRVVMSTVLGQSDVVNWEDRARWDTFLVKPYELWELVDHVRRLLGPSNKPS